MKWPAALGVIAALLAPTPGASQPPVVSPAPSASAPAPDLDVWRQYVETIRAERIRLEEDVANLWVLLRREQAKVDTLKKELETLKNGKGDVKP